MSPDGSTIVGTTWRWTADTGAVPAPLDRVHSVSGDGSVLVGYELVAETFQAARWTETGGVELLPIANFYPYRTSGQDISADGSIILGIGSKQSEGPDFEPFLWSAADGIVPIDLPGGPGSLGFEQFWRISDNGKAVVGNNANNSNSGRGFRWTKETGAVELGLLPDGLWMNATSVSADGSVVVGYTATDGANISNVQDNKEGRIKPVIWDAFHGPRYLVDVLVNEYGLGEALAGWTLSLPRGISGDGRSIIGRSPDPAGDIQAWIAYLGSPSSLAGDFNNDDAVNAADLALWRTGFGLSDTATHSDGDADGEQDVDGADFLLWQRQHGSGPSTLGGSSEVPEPSTMSMLMIGGCWGAQPRRLLPLPRRKLPHPTPSPISRPTTRSTNS
jgi:uncharacterized membrane protein